MNLALIAGAIIAFYILTRYSRGRGAGYKWLLSGCFVLLFLAGVSLATVLGKDKIWYVAGLLPIITAYIAVFISLLLKPYSLNEATTDFQVPDYLHTVDSSEFMAATFDRMPVANQKGKALHTLLRVMYVITSSRNKARFLLQRTMKTAVSLYDEGKFTTNAVFFAFIRSELTNQKTDAEIQRQHKAIECAVNLVYEAILSAHQSGELQNSKS